MKYIYLVIYLTLIFPLLDVSNLWHTNSNFYHFVQIYFSNQTKCSIILMK